MLNSTQILILSVVCIFAGVVLVILDKSESMAAILVAAGAGGFAKEIAAGNRRVREADERSRASSQKAQEALEATQTLLRRQPDQLDKPPL